MKFNKVGMFLFLLLIGLTVVSAADVSIDDATPTDIQDVVEETNIQKEVNVDNTLTKETKTVKQDKVISESVTIDENNVNEYTNQNWTVSDGVTITGTNGVTLNDVSITVGDNVQLKDLTITTTNSNTLINAVGKSNLIIEDGTFTMTNTNYDNRRTIGIDLTNANTVSVTGTTITVNAPSQSQWQYESGGWVYHMDVSAILVDGASSVTLQDNTVSIAKSGAYVSGSSMPAITVRNGASYVDVLDNTISASGAQYVYGVMMNDGVTHINIKRNSVTSTGELYVAGIDASTTNDTVVSGNTITATSTYVNVPMYDGDESLAYGIICDEGNNLTNNTRNKICSNTITISANVTYGIEMYRGVNNMICSNTITSNGHRAMGVSIAFTNYTNIVNNVIRTTKTGDDYQYFYEEITPSNNGIKFTNQSNYNLVQGNDVFTTSEGDSVAKSVNITNATGNTIQYNYLGASKVIGYYSFGSQTIVADTGNTIVGDNDNIVLYQCTCGCMSNNQDSLDFLSVNDKTLKADDDVIVITSANMATYGYDRMVLYQLSKAAANGKTVIFSQDFPRNIIYVFGDYVNVTVKEIPLNTMTFGYNGGNYTIDGLYAPNTSIHIQNQASGTITNSVIKTLNLDGVGNTIISNNTIITNNIYNISSENAIITDNYVIGYDSNNVITGNNRFTTEGTVENNNPISGDYVLNETNYNTLFNEDNTLKDTVSGTIIVVGNITTPVIINNPVNIITAPSPGKYTYYDGTTVDIEYGLSDVTFAQGSSYSNITGAQIGNIKINDNGITVSNSNITGKITVSASGAVIKDNNIVGENSLVELVNAETATIINNNIETNNTYAVTVDADSIENTIKDNTLIAGQLKGNNAIENNADDTVMQNNGPLSDPELIIDTTEFTEGQAATITATIYRGQDVQTGINKGKVVFKVNGKTLKDENGKVIYAKVVNGTATIENYAVPSSWTKENTTITATYSGSAQCDKLSSQETQITINKSAPAITTSDVTTTKTSTITLTANITDANKVINTGKVVFKINGKTVKDASGKVIYAKVVNGTVSVEYTLPETLKVGNYTITATYISSNTEKLETNSTITITE